MRRATIIGGIFVIALAVVYGLNRPAPDPLPATVTRPAVAPAHRNTTKPAPRRPAKAALAASPNAAVTVPSFRLVGTMVADPYPLSSALIARAPGQSPVIHRLGDRIGAYVLAEVTRRAVRLERTGQSVWLDLQQPDPRIVATPAPPTPAPDPPHWIEEQRPNHYLVDRHEVADYVMDLAEDPRRLAALAKARPVRDDDGTIRGYALTDIEPGSILEELGVRNGDVMVALDGRPFDSGHSVMAGFASLLDADSARFDFERGGEPITLSYTAR